MSRIRIGAAPEGAGPKFISLDPLRVAFDGIFGAGRCCYRPNLPAWVRRFRGSPARVYCASLGMVAAATLIRLALQQQIDAAGKRAAPSFSVNRFLYHRARTRNPT